MVPAVPRCAAACRQDKGVLLAGFPRTLSQARAYQARMGAPQAVLLLCSPVPSDAPPDRIPSPGLPSSSSTSFSSSSSSSSSSSCSQMDRGGACRDSRPLEELYHQQNLLHRIDGDSPEVELTQMRLALDSC
ncbi:unnamed protein product [Boreogadus saida]